MNITLEQIARRLKLKPFSVVYKTVKSYEYGVSAGVMSWVALPYDCVVFKKKDSLFINKRDFLSETPEFPADKCFVWNSDCVVVQEDCACLVDPDLYEIFWG